MSYNEWYSVWNKKFGFISSWPQILKPGSFCKPRFWASKIYTHINTQPNHPPNQPTTHSLTHSLPHSLTHCHTHSLTHSLTYPTNQPTNQPPTHPPTHPLQRITTLFVYLNSTEVVYTCPIQYYICGCRVIIIIFMNSIFMVRPEPRK